MIYFTPPPGTILMCDFDMACVAPEMRKKRRVVVVSPRGLNGRHGENPGKCVVVPLSATLPRKLLPSHVFIPNGVYDTITKDVWAICETVAHVSHLRLDRVPVGKEHKSGQMTADDLDRIRAGLKYAMMLP